MKVAVECKSPLLQKSLEMFLAKYLSSKKQCDIVVRDLKCLNDARCFYISSEKDSDLIKPFSKSQLLLALGKKYKNIKSESLETDEEIDLEEPLSFDILEKRIEFLTAEYQKNILRAVRAFYER